ncbi:MAG: hypothetical protein WCG42_10255 [Parachlamydiaceae bacterium]
MLISVDAPFDMSSQPLPNNAQERAENAVVAISSKRKGESKCNRQAAITVSYTRVWK